MGFLDITNVTKSYGAVEVLHRVNTVFRLGDDLEEVGKQFRDHPHVGNHRCIGADSGKFRLVIVEQ